MAMDKYYSRITGKLINIDEKMRSIRETEYQAPPAPEKKDKVKSLYDLEMMEQIQYGYNKYVLRVPGGWIFDRADGSVFVPFVEHDEKLTL